MEGETLACGTGASAAAYIAYKLGLIELPVDIKTKGGELLSVDMDSSQELLYLEGDTKFLFQFYIFPDALM